MRTLLLALAALCAFAASAHCAPASPLPQEPASEAKAPSAKSSEPAKTSSQPAEGSLWTRPGSDDWPRFLGPEGDGRLPDTAFAEPLDFAARPPETLWSVPAGDGHASPAVVDGRLFLFDAEGQTQRLTAYRAESGEQLWRSSYEIRYRDYFGGDAGPKATPTVTGDSVCTFDVGGTLRCHGVSDGELRWQVDTTSKYGVRQNFFGAGSSPWAESLGSKTLLFVTVGGSPAGSDDILRGPVPANGTGLIAFDLATGEEDWRSGDELASYSSPVVRTVDGQRLGFAHLRDHLLVFQPADGKILHRFPWRARNHQSVNAATPVVQGSDVFLTEAYGPGAVVVSLAQAEPAVRWQDPRRDKALATRWITPILHQGILYGAHGTSGSIQLRAVDFATGKVQWSQRGLGRFSLLGFRDQLLITTEDGQLLLLPADPKTYRPSAPIQLQSAPSQDLIGPVWAPPALARGILFVRGERELVAIDLR
ncbi:MAG: PQQ-binding-like beta-propeller repeat protein [Acidobacteriota bacterium]